MKVTSAENGPEQPPGAQEEPVEAEVVTHEYDMPPEVREAAEDAVRDALGSQEMVVSDPQDRVEGMVAMDAHDSARFVERLVRQAQEQNLGKRWIYELPKGGGKLERGLTVDAVEDITQQMNWSGRCRIAILPDTLQARVVEADEGDGPEPFWEATIAARDEISGSVYMGTSMEPQKLKLKPSTADAKRKDGKSIPEDNRVFDRFSRAKAINKAERNALEKHIPEVVKVTLIAMASQNPALVERIETAEEAKIKDMPAPLDTPEAKALTAEMATVYDEIRELGGGKGKLLLPPGRYNAALLHAQHDLAALQAMKLWLEQRRDEIRAQLKPESKETS